MLDYYNNIIIALYNDACMGVFFDMVDHECNSTQTSTVNNNGWVSHKRMTVRVDIISCT